MTMTTPTVEHFPELLLDRTGPCVSIYLPTGRRFPASQQDVVRFRNLLRQAESALANEMGAAELEAFTAPLHELADSDRFWSHALDGLAVFLHADFYKVYKLQRAVPERAIVAESFHIKPLLRVLQSADRFQMLAITRDHVRLFQGNRDAVDEITMHASVPRTLTEALGEEVTESHTALNPVGQLGHGGAHIAMHAGSGSRKDEIDKDTERFFRVVDRAIVEHHTKHSGLPMVLVALPEHHAVFRGVSHNALLLPDAIAGNPDAFSPDELRQKAWEIVEPRYTLRLQGYIDEYGAALPRGLASDVLSDAAMAALGGRVRALLVDDDRVVPGHVDRATAQVSHGELDDPHVEDILDDLAEIVLRMGGDVVMVPRDRMPSTTGIAAIYRF
ncbi:hypothetical protein [Gemmatimonas sp.]|uniref:baeRF3 domain-containing protein n=1 Tax=Gemmatimonas sp. TaxID=1962908 RepID=UPI00356479CC